MYYLAYGSNLHPLRLTERTPGARLVGTTRVDGYRLEFRKRSVDGSAKCTLSLTGASSDAAYGAVFSLPDNEVTLLDEIEGLGQGYEKEWISVDVGGKAVSAFTYIASHTHLVDDLAPYHWYKAFVLAGARELAFPPGYIRQLDAVDSQYDDDTERRTRNERLLSRIARSCVVASRS